MPKNVIKMLSTSFVMRLQVDENHAIEVKVSGLGLKYDTETGAILAGKIATIELSNMSLIGTKFVAYETHKLGGLNMPAEKLADFVGNTFWNAVEMVNAAFDKFAQIHDAVNFSYFSADKNVAYGSDYNDKLIGSSKADYMTGGAGNDVLIGGSGDDHMDGGAGNDVLNGGAGNDLMIDTFGRNSFSGGTGNDAMRGGEGNDRMTGSNGRDIFYGAGGTDTYSGGRDADVFVFNAKDATTITISDFNKMDSLVNLAAGDATEAYKMFLEHADQVGRNVVYRLDDATIILKNFELGALTEDNFMTADIVKEAGLLF